MKKLILMVLTSILVIGCIPKPSYGGAQEILKEKELEEKWYGFRILVIDSCEYLYRYKERINLYQGFGQSFMAHKGNCKFCSQRKKQELKELLNK